MDYFDIHSHLYFPDYDTDREAVIANMKEQGIWTTTIGTDIESSKQAIALAEKYENIYASVGHHPAHEIQDSVFNIQKFEELAKHPKVVAIGECGFDFYRTEPAFAELRRGEQKKVFEQQIDLAVRNQKALMLHCRPTKGTMDAYEECLDILEPLAKEHGEKLFGNAHFFVGDMDILRRFLEIGFTVSFTGVITFVSDYNETVRYTPLESIHAETDAPFVSPVLHRGKRNSPEYIAEIVRALALIRDEDVEVVKTTLISNAKRLFRLG
jgi:TatD DNase family protein